MSGPLKRLRPKMSQAPAPTSSPGSADGITPCDSQDGQQTDLFGQVLVPASRSLSRVGARGQMILDIFGPRGGA